MTDVEVHEGLEGVIAFRTEIAEPDKEGSALRYRGVDIEDLAGRVPFENVWGLLVDGSFTPGLPPAEPYNIAIHTGRQAQVLINGDLHDSPWVDPEQLKACGTLVAIDISPNAPDGIAPKVAAAMQEAATTGVVTLPATRDPNGPQITLKWGVVPPTGGCRPIPHTPHWEE